MDRDAAAALAREKMNEHGLQRVRFEFDRGKRRLGAAHYYAGHIDRITLSGYWVVALDEEEVLDVILHEIAHGLTPFGSQSHGSEWRSIARRIGAKAQRCAAPSEEAKARMAEIAPFAWVGTCPRAGHSTGRHRRPSGELSCGQCSRRFDPTNIIVWKRNT